MSTATTTAAVAAAAAAAAAVAVTIAGDAAVEDDVIQTQHQNKLLTWFIFKTTAKTLAKPTYHELQHWTSAEAASRPTSISTPASRPTISTPTCQNTIDMYITHSSRARN